MTVVAQTNNNTLCEEMTTTITLPPTRANRREKVKQHNNSRMLKYNQTPEGNKAITVRVRELGLGFKGNKAIVLEFSFC